MKKQILIDGMSCGHCTNHVKAALEELKGVTHVEVDLQSKTAVIEGNEEINNSDIKFAIEDAGYDVINITE